MLPARPSHKTQLSAGEKIVLAGALIAIRRKQRLPVEVPEGLHAAAAVVVAGAKTKITLRGNRHADVRTFGGIGVLIVDALAVRVELVAEKVVVETAARAGKRPISVRRLEGPAVRTKAQFGRACRPVGAPHLHHAGH